MQNTQNINTNDEIVESSIEYKKECDLTEFITFFTEDLCLDSYFLSDTDKNNSSNHSNSTVVFHSGTSYDDLCGLYFKQPTKKYNLIVDLDETLIHTISTSNINEIQQYLTSTCLMFSYTETQLHDPFNNNYVFVFERPYMKKFLTELHHFYDIYLYTNSTHLYAKRIISMIECNLGFNPFVEYYTRQYVNPVFIKSLNKIIKDTEHCNSVIIDDSPEVWPNAQHNLIGIKKWTRSLHHNYELDCELNKLIDLLININRHAINNHITIVDSIKFYKRQLTNTNHDEIFNKKYNINKSTIKKSVQITNFCDYHWQK